MQEVITEMRQKGINTIEWIDREEWRRKIKRKKTLGAERCENTDIL